MDFGARFYDPRVGRFISPDPIKDVSSANVVNPYAYCMNNPLRYTDKFGLRAGANPKPPSEEGGGTAGGGHATGFGWEAMDPIPFSAYRVYYGASWNGQSAWFQNNATAWAEQARREMAKAAKGDALTGGFKNTTGQTSSQDPWFFFYDEEAAGADQAALEHMQEWGAAQDPEIIIGGEQYTEGYAGSLPKEVYLERMGDTVESFTEQAGSKLDLFGMEGHGYINGVGEHGIGGYTYTEILQMVKPYLKANANIVLFCCHGEYEQSRLNVAVEAVFGKGTQIKAYIYGGNRFFVGYGDIYRRKAYRFQ
jgi:hypothetical protein